MIQRKGRYPGPGGMFVLSLCVHLAAGLLIWWCQLLPEFQSDAEPVTYVDVVNLPVVSPQAGSTVAPATSSAPASAPLPVSPPAAMTLPKTKVPGKPQAKVPAKAQTKPQSPGGEPSAVEDDRQFSERMAKLARQAAEDKRQADVLDKIRKKSAKAGTGKVGMPAGTGTEAGSDYGAYVQSRLKDAFIREVTASSVKSPVVIATVTIDHNGHIDYRVEKISGDPLFDDAVARAVTVAGQSLRAPPGGVQFSRRFRFRPEGVGVR